jgi:hypothetical protein
MGNMTMVLNVLIPWCVFTINATSTPKSANTKQDISSINRNSGLISIVGARIKPTAYMASALINPLITPIKALPTKSSGNDR